MAEELKRKVITLNVGSKKYRYTEILEVIKEKKEKREKPPILIDLTKDESFSERRPAAKGLRVDINIATTPDHLSPEHAPDSPRYSPCSSYYEPLSPAGQNVHN